MKDLEFYGSLRNYLLNSMNMACITLQNCEHPIGGCPKQGAKNALKPLWLTPYSLVLMEPLGHIHLYLGVHFWKWPSISQPTAHISGS